MTTLRRTSKGWVKFDDAGQAVAGPSWDRAAVVAAGVGAPVPPVAVPPPAPEPYLAPDEEGTLPVVEVPPPAPVKRKRTRKRKVKPTTKGD